MAQLRPAGEPRRLQAAGRSGRTGAGGAAAERVQRPPVPPSAAGTAEDDVRLRVRHPGAAAGRQRRHDVLELPAGAAQGRKLHQKPKNKTKHDH